MDINLETKAGIRLAIEGCGHGTLHAIYASVAEACKRRGWPGVDLLIVGGDFQAVRNAYDLNCVSMPAKYRSMCDFHEYYSGQRKAPYLTVFVGGNHEASNYLFELYYGGWVAPNIYYFGAANVIRLGSLRIAGTSGIWKGYNYRKPHFERLPYNESDMRSIYHVRELDVRKLLQIRTQVDIGVSHDWPNGVEWKGDWKQLFRYKPHLEKDARAGQLGSVAAKYVLDWLRPRWWFSAHLHCKYAAIVEHNTGGDEKRPATNGSNHTATSQHEDGAGGSLTTGSSKNVNEIDLDLDVDDESEPSHANADEIVLEMEDTIGSADTTNGTLKDVATPPGPNLDEARAALPEAFRRPEKPEIIQIEPPPAISNKRTDFLALDKCLPGQRFLQLIETPTADDVEAMRPLKLEYDREWLAITRTFALDEPIPFGEPEVDIPKLKKPGEYAEMIDKHMLWVIENIKDSDLVIDLHFEAMAPVYDGGNWNSPQYSQVREYPNPQTVKFCKLLEIPNPFDISDAEIRHRMTAGPRSDPDAGRFANKRGRGGFGHQNRGGGRGRGHGRGRGSFRGL